MVESVVQKSPFVLPTYQTNLNLAIASVISRMNEGSVIGTWMSLETLYTILPPSIRDDLKEQYEKIQNMMRRATQRARNPDPLVEQANQSHHLTMILRTNNRTFFEEIIQKLHKNGYLEKVSREVPIGSE